MSGPLKKYFGQHFLHDAQVLSRIVHAIDPKPGEALVEIGPGSGALTMPLLDAVGALTAIELDRDLHAPLRQRALRHGTLDLIEANVLDVDFSALSARLGRPLRVVGNLPYYLSSPILFHCIEHVDVIEDMVFMLQNEVVERIAAAPGSKTYGRISVMLQLVCHTEPVMKVPPTAFTPPPKVDSAVIRLRPRLRAERPESHSREISAVVRAAFGQRRKTLGNALKGVLDAEQIRACGIDPRARAETLPPQAFVQLAHQLAAAPLKSL